MDENNSNIEDLKNQIANLQEKYDELLRQVENSVSESPYKRLAEESRDGILIIQGEVIKYLNDGFIKMVGYEREEVINKSYGDFVPPEEFEKLKVNATRRISGEDVPSVYDTVLITKNKTTIPIEINVAIADVEGKTALVVAIRDISIIAKHQRERDKTLHFFRTLLDTIPIPVFYKDAKGIYGGCNRGFSELTGLDEAKLVGSSVFDLFDDELAQKYHDADQTVFRKREKQSYETTIRNIDGEMKDVILVKDVFYRQDGEIGGLVGVVFDISDRKKIAKELEEKTKFLESLLRKLPVVLFSVNSNGIFTLSEGEGLKAFGLKPGEVVGRSIYDVYKTDGKVLDSFNRALSGEMFIEQGYFNDYFFETYYTPMFDKNKKIEGIIGIGLDITKRKKAQEEIQKYILELQENKQKLEEYSKHLSVKNQELEESEQNLIELNTSKDKFFSIISHDLRSPFTSLIGLSDFMYSDFEELEREELKQGLGSFNRNARNIFALLENLLAWAKIQMGRQEIDLKEVNLKEVVLSIGEVFKLNLKNKNISFDVNILEDIVLFVDQNMLDAAVRNLISNCIKFTPKDGKITVSASCQNSLCIVEIADTGVGMEENQIQQLFSLESVKSTPGLEGETGSGLGLVLAKELIEANGGQIAVDSVVGKGTTFKITFPYLKKS
ncbi:MAG: PAS domain S-box protein [Bacteroidetes bacterium]|nr:PAS domain S-box protein [Bacteroidota bacterium]